MNEPLDYQGRHLPTASQVGCARRIEIAAGTMSLLLGTSLMTLVIAEAIGEGIDDEAGVSLRSLVGMVALCLVLAGGGLYGLIGDRLWRAWRIVRERP